MWHGATGMTSPFFLRGFIKQIFQARKKSVEVIPVKKIRSFRSRPNADLKPRRIIYDKQDAVPRPGHISVCFDIKGGALFLARNDDAGTCQKNKHFKDRGTE